MLTDVGGGGRPRGLVAVLWRGVGGFSFSFSFPEHLCFGELALSVTRTPRESHPEEISRPSLSTCCLKYFITSSYICLLITENWGRPESFMLGDPPPPTGHLSL